MKKIRLMEVCGTHTMAIAKAGIKKLLPSGIELVSGPGCPVCVTAQGDIDRAIEISRFDNVIMTTFGDMMRVPGTKESLDDMRGKGHDVRLVYSCRDALNIARYNTGKKVVFMGVGFETTSPTVAATVIEAEKKGIRNFFVLSDFKLIFPALEIMAKSEKPAIDGFICPGHVSVITGSMPYEKIAAKYGKPCVIAGFETADILKSIIRLTDLIKRREYSVVTEYKRAVKRSGNRKAQKILNSVFEKSDTTWRGLGMIGKSGLRLKNEYRRFDAGGEFRVKIPRTKRRIACICGDILKGAKSPVECKLFGKACTPRKPVGPCMVSSEGTCAACYKYEK
ncbi:MAG: hydrogenase formation protein HypD [Candidatus Omnitrophica bacterium]|nr:hydrogenase formation protein HypD [Candidatus Omnitrophota bacterium]